MQFFHKNKSQASLLASSVDATRPRDSDPHTTPPNTSANTLNINTAPQQYSAIPPPPPSSRSSPSSPGDSFRASQDSPQYHQHYPYSSDHYDYGYTQPTHPAHSANPPYAQRFPDQSPPQPPRHSSLPPPYSLHQQQPTRLTLNVPTAGPLSDTSPSQELSASDLPSSTPQSPSASPQIDSQQRKSKRSFFGLKDGPSKVLGRNLSVRKKGPNQNPSARRSLILQTVDPTPEHEESPIDSRMQRQHVKSNSQTQNQYVYPTRNFNRPAAHVELESHDASPVHRVNTDPTLSQESFHSRSTDQPGSRRPSVYQQIVQQPAPRNPHFQIDQPEPAEIYQGGVPQAPADHKPLPPIYSQLEAHHGSRPPSQQSFGPPSPLPAHNQTVETSQQRGPFRQPLQPSASSSPEEMAPERQGGIRSNDNPAQNRQARDHQNGSSSQPQHQHHPNLQQDAGYKSNASHQNVNEQQERETPPPQAKGRDDLADIDVRALLQKHEELQTKYIKVKKYYFEKDGQVQQLQNTVAHQRMSTSRTVLDDNEYATRFSRLDGAVNNLAFNIRKEWKSIPPWLHGVVNEDAHTVGTKEMTAVGRACLSRWLVDEIFDRYFHPGLEPNLSRQLKMIEKNVRRMGNVASEEDKENHLSKLSSWRRTTLDGVAETLQTKMSEDHQNQLTRSLVEKLTASLEMNLKSPPPPGLENSVSMIVELAVGIASNIPYESREIGVEYFLPGSPIADAYMKFETILPPLINPAGDSSRLNSEPPSAVDDQRSMKDLQSEIDLEKDASRDSSSSSHSGHISTQQVPQLQHPQALKDPKKKSVFGALKGKKPSSGTNTVPSEPGRPGSAMQREREELEHRENENRIRFAAFVAVEVRGKNNVILKAPVYGFT